MNTHTGRAPHVHRYFRTAINTKTPRGRFEGERKTTRKNTDLSMNYFSTQASARVYIPIYAPPRHRLVSAHGRKTRIGTVVKALNGVLFPRRHQASRNAALLMETPRRYKHRNPSYNPETTKPWEKTAYICLGIFNTCVP